MYTEGYAGDQRFALVSASGDNFWREVNIEMLHRDIGTATVFEQNWGGDASFTEWVAHYAFNVSTYCHLGSKVPKEMVVTTKNHADWREYPKSVEDPNTVKHIIGKAQLKECIWLKSTFDSKRS